MYLRAQGRRPEDKERGRRRQAKTGAACARASKAKKRASPGGLWKGRVTFGFGVRRVARRFPDFLDAAASLKSKSGRIVRHTPNPKA